MKKIWGGLIVLAALICFGSVNTMGGPVPESQPNVITDFRAVWVASVSNLDWPSKPGLSVSELKSEADYILDTSADIGLNAVFFQVRPNGDALYKSNIFPWSEYLTGVQGQDPGENFDPLAYWIEGAHSRGLELHAWINPYRVTRSTTDPNVLAANNPARNNPGLVKAYENGLYYDPGIPQNRSLIVSGIEEIINNYDVDGIHLDDYFYPEKDFNDDVTYSVYGTGFAIKDEWRRENVNALVREIQWAVKSVNPDIRFGISPAGIWQNSDSSVLGSATQGFEAYSSIFSDSRRWIKENWVDYICPQIYWFIGYDVADYSILLEWWADVCKDTGVELYIGTAAYREDEGQENWSGEVIRQLKLSSQYNVAGHAFFRFQHLKGSVGRQIKEYYAGPPVFDTAPIIHEPLPLKPMIPGQMPLGTPVAGPVEPGQSILAQTVPAPVPDQTVRMDKLALVQPGRDDTVTDARGYYFYGTSDPSKELFVNGWPVTDRTEEGFFSVYVELGYGATGITLTQEGQEPITRTITNNAPADPGPSGPPREPMEILDFGLGSTSFAEVNADMIWAYPGNTTTGGSSWTLYRGQKDRVIARTEDGEWLKLQSGCWVESENMTVTEEAPGLVLPVSLYGGTFAPAMGDSTHTITWNATGYPAAFAKTDGKTLYLYFGALSQAPDLDLLSRPSMDGTIFESVTSGYENGAAYFAFTIRPEINLEGYYTEYQNGQFKFFVKTRKTLAGSPYPLAGFTFVVDAGHGMDDIGARGPMDTALPEKDINLAIVRKLRDKLQILGAHVTMVRDGDTFQTLDERTVTSRQAMPDMFISIHCNSMAEVTDSTAIRGLTVWYRNETSLPLANWLSEKLHTVNPGTTRRADSNQANYFVCRPSWAPSVIIESSFINNIYDFSWLIKNSNQEALAQAIAGAVEEYYR